MQPNALTASNFTDSSVYTKNSIQTKRVEHTIMYYGKIIKHLACVCTCRCAHVEQGTKNYQTLGLCTMYVGVHMYVEQGTKNNGSHFDQNIIMEIFQANTDFAFRKLEAMVH